MFINCRHCHALVATDPATDLPPERCPRCRGVLRRPDQGLPAAPAATAPPAPALTPAATPPPPLVRDAPAPAPGTAQGPATSAAPGAPDGSGTDATPTPSGVRDEVGGAMDTRSPPSPETPGHAASALARQLHGREGPPAPAAGAPAAIAGEPAPAPAAPTPPPAATTEPPRTGADATAVHPPADTGSSSSPDAGSTPTAGTNPDTGSGSDDASPASSEAEAQADTAGADADAAVQPAAGREDPADPADHGQAPASAPVQASPVFAPGASDAAARAAARRERALGVAAIAALVLLLALQIVLADRERLAADPDWRPLAAAACGLLGCELPPWSEPSAIVLAAREVRPHPDRAHALQVRASFRNDARWAQAWPRLLLTLSDVDGRAVAARAFEPHEYLGAAPTARFAPGQTADITLDIHEPSASTVSYAFDFRP